MSNAVIHDASGHGPSGRRYYFDLVRDGTVVRDPGGLVLRDDAHAIDAAEQLARTLRERSDLQGRRCAIHVRDERGKEFQRVVVEASSSCWM